MPDLQKEIQDFKKEHIKPITKNAGMNQGIRAGTEFIASIGVGCALGYFLDKGMDTKPLFFILGFFFGIAAGFMSLYRINKNLDNAVGFKGLQKGEKDAK